MPVIAGCVAQIERRGVGAIDTNDTTLFIVAVVDAHAHADVDAGSRRVARASGESPRRVRGGRFGWEEGRAQIAPHGPFSRQIDRKTLSS